MPDLMRAFAESLGAAASLHPVAFAAEAHDRLVSIHPFIDGNGRTATLLMNGLLMALGFPPPAIIRPRDRTAYLGALETAQLGGPATAYQRLIARAVDRLLDIYLDAAGAGGERATEPVGSAGETLLKIGQLAEAVGESVPTIRHWMKSGLLPPAQVTPAGYHLFTSESVERCRRIQMLKGRRLTLAEIRDTIDEPTGGARAADRRGIDVVGEQFAST